MRNLASIILLAMIVPVGAAAQSNQHIDIPKIKGCGVERWEIKTLQDSPSNRTSTIIHTSVEDLTKRPKGKTKSELNKADSTRFPEEKVLYEIPVLLLGAKLEADGDFHIVVADPDSVGPRKKLVTMIVEIPSPDCIPQSTDNIDLLIQLGTIRLLVVNKLGHTPTSTYRRISKPIPATLLGYGFFDFQHHQTGVAPNAFELHPVLNIDFDN